jgi:ferrous-iron efflux pump FieF
MRAAEKSYQTLPQTPYQRLVKRAALASVLTAATLILVKFAAYLLTDSLSLLTTLVDSLLDIAASILNLLAIRLALQPADHEHRFGHGKIESLAALGQVLFISSSSIILLIEATSRLFSPQSVDNPAIGVGVMIFSIILTLCLIIYQRRTLQQAASIAIKADAMHYVGDVMTNAAVLGAFVIIAWKGWIWVDPLLAASIAIYFMTVAWRVGREAVSVLIDRELSDADRQKIIACIYQHPKVRAVHDLRTRSAGQHVFIQYHLELDPAVSLLEAHYISDQVEEMVLALFPNAEIISHQDPAGIEGMPPELAQHGLGKV